MNQAGNFAGVILFFFICLFVYTKLAGPIPFTVNNITTTKTDLFTSQGTGEEKAVPDTAMVVLGVTKSASTAEEAKNQMNSITNTIVADLKALGIEEKNIKTTNFSVNPEIQPAYDTNLTPQVPPKGTVPSFTASQNLEVTTKTIAMANQAIDTATKDGANTIGTPTFVVNDEKRKALTKQARIKAIADAKKNAAELADEAGIKLGRVINIQENSGYGLRYAAMDKAAESTGQTQLNPGENTISVTVTLSFETL